jgi:hypothetical protein
LNVMSAIQLLIIPKNVILLNIIASRVNRLNVVAPLRSSVKPN